MSSHEAMRIETSAAAETRSYGRAAGLLTGALGCAGLLTYLYFALISHSLSSSDYGAVVVVWSTVYIAASTFFRPIEQLLARSLAELEHRPRRARREVLRVAGTVQLGLLVLLLGIALALRGPIEDGLLEEEAVLYGVLLVALVGFGAGFYARGLLAGSRNFRGYAALVVLEAVTRVAFALALALGISDDPAVAAVAIAAAPIASLAVIPFALRSQRRHQAPPAAAGGEGRVGEAPGAAAEGEFTLAAGSGFAAAVLIVMLGDQVIVNSGVLFVRASEGASEAGFIFNVLMLVRAPLVLFLAVTASLLPHLARLRARSEPGDEEAFRAAVNRTLLVSGLLGLVAILSVLVAGPQLMEIAFGAELSYDRAGLLIVAAGMGVYLAAQTLSQAALAQGQATRAATCWAAAAAAFVIWNLLAGVDEVRRVEVGFSAAAVLLCGLLYGVYRRPQPRPEESIEPGSARDLEVALARADEIA